jgi:hypothetical protein
VGVDDLEARLHQAVRDVAWSVSLPDVPGDRVYVRDVLSFSPQRDSVPAVVIARTPQRPVGRVKRLSWVDWSFPVTVLLLASQGGRVATDEPWRAGWAPRLFTELDRAATRKTLIDEAKAVGLDQLTILDLSAFEQAGLWRSAVSVNVLCRTPYPPT